MFKSNAQLSDVISQAKAYDYELTQTIATALQVGVEPELEDRVLNTTSQIRNIIKSMEFIGSDNANNNILENRLQELIKKPSLDIGYVGDGYVQPGYVS